MPPKLPTRLKGELVSRKDFFQAMAEVPLPVQLSLLRRLQGFSQVRLASRLRMKQSYLSRLEIQGSGHLLRQYEEVAKALGARVALLPRGARVIWK